MHAFIRTSLPRKLIFIFCESIFHSWNSLFFVELWKYTIRNFALDAVWLLGFFRIVRLFRLYNWNQYIVTASGIRKLTGWFLVSFQSVVEFCCESIHDTVLGVKSLRQLSSLPQDEITASPSLLSIRSGVLFEFRRYTKFKWF